MKLFAQCDRSGTVAPAGQAEGGTWVLPPGWLEVSIGGFDFQLCTTCVADWTAALATFMAQILPGPQPVPATPLPPSPAPPVKSPAVP